MGFNLGDRQFGFTKKEMAVLCCALQSYHQKLYEICGHSRTGEPSQDDVELFFTVSHLREMFKCPEDNLVAGE